MTLVIPRMRGDLRRNIFNAKVTQAPQLGIQEFYAGLTVGEWLEFDVWLSAGTYSVDATFMFGTQHGIFDFYVDGGIVRTGYDLYDAGFLDDPRAVKDLASGVVIASSGLHSGRVQITGKNASSTAAHVGPGMIQFRRTA